jgi:flagellar motility protein MotE (MotC chaperone)
MILHRLLHRPLRLVLTVALAGNLLLLADALTTGHLVPRAGAQTAANTESVESDEVAAEPETSLEQVYGDLAEALRKRTADMELRSAALEQQERQVQVLLAELDAARASLEQERSENLLQGRGFQHLLRSYENMEPENAARAIEELYGKDPRAVTDTLLGIGPRQSGAILDALASTRPELAASISFEIIKRDPSRASAGGS